MKTTGKKDPLNVSCIKRSILRKKTEEKEMGLQVVKEGSLPALNSAPDY